MESKNNNQLVSFAINFIIPLLILIKLSKEEYLGPVWGLVIALAFPLIFGLYELLVQKKRSVISAIGFVGVLLTGIIGILKFPPQWIAVKEAAIPFLIGLFVLISTKKPWQVITKFIYNKEFLDIDTIEERLQRNESKNQLDGKLSRANLFLSFSFFFSALLNFFLAKVIVQSLPGTSAFNEEIGRMTMLSFPVIALPSTLIIALIFWYIISSIKKITHLSSDEIFAEKFRSEK